MYQKVVKRLSNKCENQNFPLRFFFFCPCPGFDLCEVAAGIDLVVGLDAAAAAGLADALTLDMSLNDLISIHGISRCYGLCDFKITYNLFSASCIAAELP
jgi:hypothetical protein